MAPTLLAAAALVAVAGAFQAQQPQRAPAAALGAARRDFLGAGAAAACLPFLVAAAPANAASLNKVEKALSGLGLPALGELPGGFNALLETYSQGRGNKPLLVRFAFPSSWLVVKPSVNTNGESGTISAGDYGKADSASLFVSPEVGELTSREFLNKVVVAGISQRGDNQYQSFKLGKVTPGEKGYTLVEYKYELLTGAGFVIERTGVASVTSVGTGSQALITVTTSTRWKKLEDTLKAVANSFRVYETTAEAVNTISSEDN
ncbi:hypothetical protein M885DRAFT_519338 [Pelagophyceae sp. CCMP2097]|nr:hypothetical protein M885DRAFT_519338 [Pelagophyceae sp. CCMP2097]|mmetsp:Transcript_18801/g.63515  ORF Transcript_18801/g.63515 Transcript_18801/m.63515 type:complete len:262 (-) Transcript_18801:215-1000(-)